MRLSLHLSEPQHQPLPALLVPVGSFPLCTPHQPDCRPATGTRDRNIAEILEIAQLSFLAASNYPCNRDHRRVAAPTHSDLSQSIQEPTVLSIRIYQPGRPQSSNTLAPAPKELTFKVTTQPVPPLTQAWQVFHSLLTRYTFSLHMGGRAFGPPLCRGSAPATPPSKTMTHATVRPNSSSPAHPKWRLPTNSL